MARPPARLATISSSCCSWARASNQNALKTPNKSGSVSRHTNAARRNIEHLRPRLRVQPGLATKSGKNLRATRPLWAKGVSGLTLSQPEGTDGCAIPETQSEFLVD